MPDEFYFNESLMRLHQSGEEEAGRVSARLMEAVEILEVLISSEGRVPSPEVRNQAEILRHYTERMIGLSEEIPIIIHSAGEQAKDAIEENLYTVSRYLK